MSQQLVNLLTRLMADQSVPEAVRRDIIEALLSEPGQAAGVTGAGLAPPTAAVRAASPRFTVAAPATAPSTRRLVYVHGICRHVAGFSDPWFHALQPQLSGTFGAGQLGATRLEVIWSDIVNQAAAIRAAAVAAAATTPAGATAHAAGTVAAAPLPAATAAEQSRRQAAAEIREALSDRADQHVMHAAAVRADSLAAGPVAANAVTGLISIPGLNCVDDFSIYLTSDAVRQQIIDRFTAVVGPQLQAGVELDIVSHSWGTVVAYEGLRELADQGITTPLVHNWFTVGAALSIGPVKARLRPANQDGRKPDSVQRWVNLDARGDLVGGPLKDRPYQVDLDFVNLDPVGCGSFLGLVNPACAHGSYFVDANLVVNRDIFARFINA